MRRPSPLIPISTGVLDDYYIARPRWSPFINGFHFYLIRCCVCACAGALVLAVGLASYSSVSQLSHTYVYIHQHTRYREINPKPRGSLVSLSTRICVQCSSSEQCQRIDEYDTPRFVREERGEGGSCVYLLDVYWQRKGVVVLSLHFPLPANTTDEKNLIRKKKIQNLKKEKKKRNCNWIMYSCEVVRPRQLILP